MGSLLFDKCKALIDQTSDFSVRDFHNPWVQNAARPPEEPKISVLQGPD